MAASRKNDKFRNKVQNVVNKKINPNKKRNELEKMLATASSEEAIMIRKAISNLRSFNYQVCGT